MSQLTEDWISFCKNKNDFDKSHFFTLFHEDYDDVLLSKMLYNFPSSKELIERIKCFQTLRKIRQHNTLNISDDEIIQLVKRDFLEKAIVFKELGEDELYCLITKAVPLIENSRSKFDLALQAGWPNGEKQVVLCDYFLDKWKIKNNKIYALFEAFYGAANCYEVQWYLGAPLIDTTVDFSYYLTMWSYGIDVALADKHILIFK